MPIKYRIESDGKYHAQANAKDSKYGLTFSSYPQMRNAFKRKFKLKKVKNKRRKK